MVTTILYKSINEQLIKYKEELLEKIDDVDVDMKSAEITSNLSHLTEQKISKEKTIIRVMDAFEQGVYNLQQFNDQKQRLEKMIADLNEQINILHLEQKEYEKENIRDKYELLNKFISKIFVPPSFILIMIGGV